jgi:C-terminal processing protease CtpA/Prc
VLLGVVPPAPAHRDPAHCDPAHRDPAHRDPAHRDAARRALLAATLLAAPLLAANLLATNLLAANLLAANLLAASLLAANLLAANLLAATIVDLRDNGGGDSDTVAFVASYFFDDKPVHLSDIYEREANKTTPAWTLAKVPGKRFGRTKPVFVVTSAGTFSGGEDLAYSLQTTKRAIVVGEPTAGGAHPVKPVSLDDNFSIMMPYAESISPITHGNWEGTGVVPHVLTTADGALDEALKRATAATKR